MPDKIEQATAALRKFVKDRNAAPLEEAVELLEEFDLWSSAPDKRLADRRRLLLSWARAIRAIDSLKDPKFDPEKDQPSLHAPAALSGLPAADGADQRVADAEKLKARRTQIRLLELEDRAIESAHEVYEKFYTKSAADRQEAEAALKEGGLSSARIRDITTGVNPNAMPPPPPVQPDEIDVGGDDDDPVQE